LKDQAGKLRIRHSVSDEEIRREFGLPSMDRFHCFDIAELDNAFAGCRCRMPSRARLLRGSAKIAAEKSCFGRTVVLNPVL
jgi:hypothetical protein